MEISAAVAALCFGTQEKEARLHSSYISAWKHTTFIKNKIDYGP